MSKKERKLSIGIKTYGQLQAALIDSLRSGAYWQWPEELRCRLLLRLHQLRQQVWQLQKAVWRGAGRGALVTCLVMGANAARLGAVARAAPATPPEIRFGVQDPFVSLDFSSMPLTAFSDVDGDGDQDLVVGASNGQIHYFQNLQEEGSLAFAEKTGAENPFSAIDLEGVAAPAFTDVDDDGDLDLVIGSGNYFLSGALYTYERTGSQDSPVYTPKPAQENPFGEIALDNLAVPAFADIDGDGDQDVMIGTGADDGEGYQHGKVFTYLRTEGEAGPAFNETPGAENPLDLVDLPFLAFPSFADIDADGDTDALVGSLDGQIHVYQNSEAGFSEIAPAESPTGDLELFYFAVPALADIDGDGDYDLSAGDAHGAIHYFPNTGSAAEPAFAWYRVFAGSRAVPSFADLDGDGDLDGVIETCLCEADAFRYYENKGSPASPNYSTGEENPFAGLVFDETVNFTFADIDGDGDLDALYGSRRPDPHTYEQRSLVRYLRNSGSPTEPVFTGWPEELFEIPDSQMTPLVAFADLDGDGDADALIGDRLLDPETSNHQDVIRYFKNTGSGFSEQTGEANPFAGLDIALYSLPAFADIDGDGDLDMVLGTSAYNEETYDYDNFIRTFENTGTGFSEKTGANNPLGGIASSQYITTVMADFDGDGDPDLLLAGHQGRLSYFPNLTNAAPAGLILSANSVAENLPAGTVVGSFSVSDPVPVRDTWTFALVNGEEAEDNAAFEITGNQLKTKAVFDYEQKASYSIRVRVTDAGGLSYEKTFSILVTEEFENYLPVMRRNP